jgi:hypothetical protein
LYLIADASSNAEAKAFIAFEKFYFMHARPQDRSFSPHILKIKEGTF